MIFLTSDGKLVLGDIGLKTLESINCVSVEFSPGHLPEVSKEQAARYDAIISMAPRYTQRSFSSPNLGLTLAVRLDVL